jgi:hypothetical protein
MQETTNEMIDRLLAMEQHRIKKLLERIEPDKNAPAMPTVPTTNNIHAGTNNIHITNDKAKAELILLSIKLQLAGTL